MSQPARSSNASIPQSSNSTPPSRNIESTMAIPVFRPVPPNLFSPQGILQRGVLADEMRRNAALFDSQPSSSVPTSEIGARLPSRTVSSRPHGTFEPRVIRPNVSGIPCLPSSPSIFPAPRRSSAASGSRTTNPNRASPKRGASDPPPNNTAVAFARPAYLEHSSLRHLLHSEISSVLPPTRKAETSPTTMEAQPLLGRGHPPMSPPTDSDEESNVTPPHNIPPATSSPTVASSDVVLVLPSRWSDQVRHPSLSISSDGREVAFNGPPANSESQASAARTTHPVPPACGIYYYEVHIVNKGTKGHISIGFAGRDVKLSRLPGWEKNSWGYHGDDGMAFAADRTGTQYGPKFGTGDTIGCGIDFSQHKGFYTKDGTFLGYAFENMGKDIDIYPTVGLRYPGESIRVNFGHEPFVFDIEYHVQQQRNLTWMKILTTPLSLPAIGGGQTKDTADEAVRTKATINHLVSSYLAHHGYAKTARAFEAQCKRNEETARSAAPTLEAAARKHVMDVEDGSGSGLSGSIGNFSMPVEGDIERRTRIVNAVVAGDIDSALADTEKHYPTVLSRDEGLMSFKLRCRKFIELVLEAAELRKKTRAGDRAHYEAEMEDDGLMDMDVDDDASAAAVNGFNGGKAKHSSSIAMSWPGAAVAQYDSALNHAIVYGQGLSSDYKADIRAEVQALFVKTFGILAYEDPMEAREEVAEVVGHEARVRLANELNQAILRSQGQPVRPALESLYRHTATTILQLGLSGVGEAAFADMQKELLDT